MQKKSAFIIGGGGVVGGPDRQFHENDGQRPRLREAEMATEIATAWLVSDFCAVRKGFFCFAGWLLLQVKEGRGS